MSPYKRPPEISALPPEEVIPVIVKYTSASLMAAGLVEGLALSPEALARFAEEILKPWREAIFRHFRLIPATALRVKAGELKALEEDPRVEAIWPDKPVYALLDVSVPLIRAPQVWEKGFTGRGIKVAVVDTGIDYEHPDFSGRILAYTSFVGGDGKDDHGHGTHVAGIIAGSGEASGGKYRGVAPEALLLSAKVLRADGSGMMSDVMAGIEWAVEQGAKVINLSLGSPGPCDGTDALSAMCDAAVKAGVVVCAAAGNDGPSPGTVGSPGCAREVITVGASDDSDQVAPFSSRGPTADGRVKPDILFPGVGIVSCRAGGTSMGNPVDDFYTSASGTSMATPHASGVAALLLQAYPDLSPAQVKARMMDSALNLNLDPNTQGAGRGDALAALEAEAPQPPKPGGCLYFLRTLLRR
jgi:serine protease AprX